MENLTSYHQRIKASKLPEETELFLHAEPICCTDCGQGVRFVVAVGDSDLCAVCLFARFERIELEKAAGREISFEQAGPEPTEDGAADAEAGESER